LAYKIQIRKKVIKYLETIRKKDAERIISAIQALAIEPRPTGFKKLTGEDAYRIRIGNYRVIYEILDDMLIVYILKAGPRGDVYK
jgi:mRNA interferase RelE/StbE